MADDSNAEKRSPKVRRMEGIALEERRAARTEIQYLANGYGDIFVDDADGCV
ncbi:hypothetical protein EPUS_07771 [Endocarpon pusillum Z07020]|uniref:Uncharacterized protein n=1 Tax=Endocarpon pusillum (strain Z07020 / HMAS-L-300199) TaxID=1263415 RepID=U1HPW0_ENDPU|nr:uncharacterized protein EPUS_07771 [Endocarpon pusillum Z07020]ERF71099.1 hypothetical protein EPUS_07771 [Endocarpon pusillum Z07020]